MLSALVFDVIIAGTSRSCNRTSCCHRGARSAHAQCRGWVKLRYNTNRVVIILPTSPTTVPRLLDWPPLIRGAAPVAPSAATRARPATRQLLWRAMPASACAGQTDQPPPPPSLASKYAMSIAMVDAKSRSLSYLRPG
jgi:hypothetical protein